ncbi:Tetratricopeptide-like helical domain containing protein [Parasponia andersonii]|uniref:Tetratricopeptide-like helical domain containing protein n=1 Tax=Parasponia andersonii TaxID=3476 RepID=A0A2P5AJQ0_PARAD|nr:Tetratricopeptide-like helical domain containing protein [Parasponia andersonii]
MTQIPANISELDEITLLLQLLAGEDHHRATEQAKLSSFCSCLCYRIRFIRTMETLISQYVLNRWKPHFPNSSFLFNFPSLSRENRILLDVSRRKWPCRPGVLRFSFVRANSVSGSASYGGWDDLGDSDRSGEVNSDQFRNFLVSIGVDDRKHVFAFMLGLFCALAISRVRVSSIVVFPASVLVFGIGFSFGLVRGGGIGELNYNGNKKRVKEELFRVYMEKFRNLAEVVDEFDVKVNNLKKKVEKATDSREITVRDLEDYSKVLESISLSTSNARNVIEASNDSLGSSSVVLTENQKSNKKKKELGEIGYDFFQSLGGLFRDNLVDSKTTKVKGSIKREVMEGAVDNQTRGTKLVSSVEKRVLNPVSTNKPKGNSVLSPDPSNEFPIDENGDESIRNGEMSWKEIGRHANTSNYSKEYIKRLQLVNNHRISLKMGHDNQTETWESHDNLLESVNFSVRMQHTETEASFAEQKLEKSDNVYRSSHIREKSEFKTGGSQIREENMNGKDNVCVAGDRPGHESENPSSSSSMVSDVLFDRYLTEANDLLRQAKDFMRDGHEKERAEIILYTSAKLLSKAIAMKPVSLLAVGQLGNTYLLHGELKLRISRELRTLLYRSNPPSVGKWGRIHDRSGSKDEIASALIDVCEECEELLVEAGRKYRLALSIDGNDVRALYNWGLALTFRAQLIADIGPEASFDADKVFLAAIDKFDAMMSKGNVYAPDALFRWGVVLQQRSRLRPNNSKEKMKLLRQAKRLYEDALDLNSNNDQLREALSTCISELSSRQY